MKPGFFATVALSALAGLAIVTLIIFAAAYSSPTKSVRINIDRLGEANFEVALLSAITLIGGISIFRIRKDRKTNEAGREW